MKKNQKVLLISFIIIFIYMIVEAIGGFLTNSLALLSDAGHMLSDAIALFIALIAFKLSDKAANSNNTYGFKRFEIIAATFNGLTLLAVALYIFYEAIKRFSNPPEVATTGMLIISSVGLIVNIVVAFIMFKNADTKDNLNMRSAFLHVISDMLGSVGAIIAALLIIFFGWGFADPLASVIVAVLVLRSGYRVSRDSLHILMEGKPEHIDLEDVKAIFYSFNIIKIHDVHLWTITSRFHSLTAHVVVEGSMTIYQTDKLLHDLEERLKELDIQHITIQIESDTSTHNDSIFCDIEIEDNNLHANHNH